MNDCNDGVDSTKRTLTVRAAVIVFVLALCAGRAGAEPVRPREALSDQAKAGEAVFNIHCVACHQPEARGQVGAAPSIRNRDFLALASDEFIKNSIRKGRPGTAMVGRPDLAEEDVDAVVAYLRSLPVANPLQIQVDPSRRFQGNAETGGSSYQVYCASCHGHYGEGYGAGGPGTGIGLPGFLEVASDDYILQTLRLGRLGTPMRPFMGAKGVANLSKQEVYDIIAHLRELGKTYGERVHLVTRAADPRLGEVQFNINCSPCHQPGGKGKVGFAPTIRNRDFLALASDEFIKHTVMNGRPGTGMLPRADLPAQTVLDIISYLRALPVKNPVEIEVDPTRTYPGDVVMGETLFKVYCASCHGPTGEGYSVGVAGPAIGYPGFLQAASDDYIFQTLKQGRVGTPMKPFTGSKGLANLAEPELYNIIAYLRSMENRVVSSAGGESDYE